MHDNNLYVLNNLTKPIIIPCPSAVLEAWNSRIKMIIDIFIVTQSECNMELARTYI